MNERLSPSREAMKLTKLWRAAFGLEFPVRAGDLAKEWSRQVAPKEPISDVLEQDIGGFEGGLFWLPNRKHWTILYRPHPNLPGRVNFTVAHEFGHYVLHRASRNEFRCTQGETLGASFRNIEREADEFASFLLMPIDDFRDQLGNEVVTLDVLGEFTRRYEASMTAILLKWLSFTSQPAVVVVGRDECVLWWQASKAARNIAFGSLREGMDLPRGSMAMASSGSLSVSELRAGIGLKAGVWFPNTDVREMLITSDNYDPTISLLMLDVVGAFHDDEPDQDMTTNLPAW